MDNTLCIDVTQLVQIYKHKYSLQGNSFYLQNIMTMQTPREYGTPLVWVVTHRWWYFEGAVGACHSDCLPVALVYWTAWPIS